MIRFIHSGDLHLGKRFGSFTGDLPSRLREARHAVIARLAQHARDNGAGTILLAGDTFDTETPAPEIRRQAFAEMGRHAQIRWIILPGNHDSLQASQLWTTLSAEAPHNIVLATQPQPIELAPGAVLLPAPCTTRRPGRDLTEWMDGAPSAEGALRIGLAHGAVQSFSEEASAAEIISPDRARRAGLDYLGLGDWHGAIEVNPYTRYCGTPEPDRFKHERPGTALLIEIAGRQAIPQASPLATATFAWTTLDLHLFSGHDPLPALDALLPAPADRRQTLARIVASGHCRLPEHEALDRAIAAAAPEFAFLELDALGLSSECEVEDLDLIDPAGALREAADMLLAQSREAGRSSDDREIARAALARLYSYSQAVAS